MKRIITYTIKEDNGENIIAEEKEELHEYESNDASKYFAVKRLIDRIDDKLRNILQ